MTTARRTGPWRVVAVAVVVAVHLLALRPAVTPQHDDLVTLQLAAASLESWAQLTEAPSWQTAGTYQALVDRSAPASYGEVASQAARLDIHPPLYELLVALWLPVAGRSMVVLLLLNVAIAGALAWVAFGLARRLRVSPELGAVAAVAAAASPAILVTGLELRSYLLAALIGTALTTWAVAVVDEDDGSDGVHPGRWLQGAVLVLLLALTSYAGAHVAGGVGLAVLLFGGTWRRRLVAASSLLAGGVAALAAWPHAPSQLAEQARRQADPLFDALATRSGRVARSLASSVWAEPATWAGVGVLVGLGVLVVVACRRRGRPAVVVTVVAVAATLGQVGFYLLGRSQRWAMAPKYMALVLPLVAVLAVSALRGRRGAAITTAVLATTTALSWPAVADVPEDPPPREVTTVDAVIATNPRRGVGLRLLWHVPADTPAVVGARHDLVELLPATPGCHALIVHNDQGGGSPVRPEEIEAWYAEHGWTLSPVSPQPVVESRTVLAEREGCDP